MTTSSGQEHDPVPRALKEAVELIKSANRRFEDCAVEWQSKISHEQWKLMASADGIRDKSWEHSVLARTYFADKTLDDAFKSLLAHDKTITDHLHNFISLLRGEELPIFPTRATAMENGSLDRQENPIVDNTTIAQVNLTASQEDRRGHRTEIKSTDMITNDIQRSFSDLIKAKINFDMKFLGFEATLSSITYTDTSASNIGSGCLCQICSNISTRSTASTCASKNSMAKHSGIRNFTKRRSKRITIRTNVKRLLRRRRPARTLIGGRGKNQSVSLTEIGNDSLIRQK